VPRVTSESLTTAASGRAAEIQEMYAALLQGELSGADALTASQQMLQLLMDSMTDRMGRVT